MIWMNWVESKLESAITQNAGRPGTVSSTKLVYVVIGLFAAYGLLLATVAFVACYIFLGRADGVYATWLAGVWTTTVGLAARAQWLKNKDSKEIALGQQNQAPPDQATGGGQ